jgi:photosystem II stability/assembly factor-like uncharacterized protein
MAQHSNCFIVQRRGKFGLALIGLVLLLLSARGPSPSILAAASSSEGQGLVSARSHLQNTALSAPPSYRTGIIKQFEETSYYLKDVDFITTTVGWAVGAAHWDQTEKAYVGTIIKTSDGGETWTAQDVSVSETLRGVDFVDANNGWAVGTNGTILHTSDGGAHWISQTVATSDEFRGVVFVDANQGWATSIQPTHYDYWGDADNWQASVWHTGDGGETWVQQSLPSGASILNRIQFIDALQGWTVGVKYIGDDTFGYPEHRAAIYHTSDGGLTWEEQYNPDLEITLTGVSFVDANHGWAVGFVLNSGVTGGTVFHTSDGGTTWERQTPQATFWDVQFLDANQGYVVGFDYVGAQGPPVYRTLDGGDSWEKVLMDKHDNEGLFGVAVMADRAIAVGDYSYVCIATDPWGTYEWPWGENLFAQQYLKVHFRFEDVFFVDENLGWAVGTRSFVPELWGQVIFHTQDGGATWENQYEKPPPLDSLFSYFRLDSVYFVDSQNGWAVGSSEEKHDAILHTADGGLHWEEQGSELYASWNLEFFAVQFLDSQNGWALATDNFPSENIFLAHTTNGGTNWQWVDTGIEGSLAIGFALVQGDLAFTDAQHGWAVGGLEEIVHTENGGADWAGQDLPTASRRLFAVEFVSNQVGWIAGEGLFRTPDGGATWVEQDIEISVDFQDIKFVDSLNGWLAGDSGLVLSTNNGGDTWKLVDSGVSSSLRGLSFIDSEKGWFVGDNGVILTTAQVPYWPVYLPLVVRASTP